ncbi:glycosyltransferase family 32 protein [Gallibacterium melopsittaci]|uniref:Glycosyltransferase family 32 protein n=1 Tax=Gallibacterium melopsittaci TaxID=516063 RepID=A0ABV6HVV0_9PAST
MVNLDTFHQQRKFYFDLYRHFLRCRKSEQVEQLLKPLSYLQASDFNHEIKSFEQEQIPKVLHYCWFGKGIYPDLVKYCMDSWHTQNGFRIKLWNEDNFPIDLYPFAKEALRQKKWAMVSDVARLHALYYEGGIYLDTDMELIKPLEPLLNCQAFGCVESKRLISIGLVGARVFHPWIGKALSWYKLTPFRDIYHIIANTRIISRMTELHYGVKLNGQPFRLNDGMYFFPYDSFLPRKNDKGEFIITDNTIAIHHGTGLW